MTFSTIGKPQSVIVILRVVLLHEGDASSVEIGWHLFVKIRVEIGEDLRKGCLFQGLSILSGQLVAIHREALSDCEAICNGSSGHQSILNVSNVEFVLCNNLDKGSKRI